MESSVLASNQFVTPTRADFAIAAAQLCFLKNGDADPVPISRCASRAAARPVLVVNLEHLPHRPDKNGYDKMLSSAQADEHALILRAFAEQAFFGKRGFPPSWQWNESGRRHTVNSTSWRVNDARTESLPTRLSGDYWAKAAILTTADSRWDDRELWSRISSLPPEAIEHFPAGDAIRAYNFGHELGHVLQLCPASFVPDDLWQWQTEIDADQGSFAGLSLLAKKKAFNSRKPEFEETIKAVTHGRALSAFCASYPFYWSALRLNGHENVTYQESLLCNYELRFRVYAQMKGLDIPSSSREIQAVIDQWTKRETNSLSGSLQEAFGYSWDWGKHNDINQCMPVLNKILRGGEITDPLAAYNAELIIEAATYFCPSLHAALLAKPSFVPPSAPMLAPV